MKEILITDINMEEVLRFTHHNLNKLDMKESFVGIKNMELENTRRIITFIMDFGKKMLNGDLVLK